MNNAAKWYCCTGSIIEMRESRDDFMPLNFPVEDIHLIVQLPMNILHTYGAYPYRPALAQELMPGNQERRFDFCNFALNTLDENPDVLSEVLWSDECQFSRQSTINTQNTHCWSLENPYQIDRIAAKCVGR
ncbi:UNVERIFIED_CONTAM: hypothetical protein NCL1_37166 [Trichonephila clavipes]